MAADTSSNIESAIWSIAYGTGYRHGRSDAGNVLRRGLAGASVGYQAGYERGYHWTIDHPIPPIA